MNNYFKKESYDLKKSELSVEPHSFQELDVAAMVSGIGRKATDEELIYYLPKDTAAEPIDI